MGEAMSSTSPPAGTSRETEYEPPAPVGGDRLGRAGSAVSGTRIPSAASFKIDGYPVKVIGTLAKQGNVLGQSQDNVVYVPLTLFKKHIAPSEDIGIFIKPAGRRRSRHGRDRRGPHDPSRAAQDEVRQGRPVRARHRGASCRPLWGNISQGAFRLMILISGISLLVGAIVIANIMFVSVVERTKEIGVRRALGARKRDIRWQFLLEAALLSARGRARSAC